VAVSFKELRDEKKLKYFDKARIAWDILIQYAKDQETDTYQSFWEKIGVGKHQVGPYVLYLIREYCTGNNLPMLNCLIRSVNGGIGDRWTRNNRDNLIEKTHEVFGFDWGNIDNPFNNRRGTGNEWIY
jgi:hypothetical protein